MRVRLSKPLPEPIVFEPPFIEGNVEPQADGTIAIRLDSGAVASFDAFGQWSTRPDVQGSDEKFTPTESGAYLMTEGRGDRRAKTIPVIRW
jgi:hypothetical protein